MTAYQNRDEALAWLVGAVPYIRFLGIRFDRQGDEITAHLPFQPMLIGNPVIPALHGGVTAAFLEVAAIIELSWTTLWEDLSAGRLGPDAVTPGHLPPLPKTIDFTVDYLRSGQARDCFAKARINRSGRRYASVHVDAWQDARDKPFASAVVHFLMPEAP
ncbi:PaaI family thioesterase [Tabrizicola oligotrophica]|uniref:PaaI family thioesterase n=1 Tax=Tabrizicola oligotrophica TaxID=2710650 RepID=A0A6M0QQW3_9RHOB|nr:PaaI family thioesterase [Tabrizicola oligotrophica]NEY89746.1 PaaI family thioesterase [Tabrizicola oligotrophica]